MQAEQILQIDVINGVINPLPGIKDPGDAGLDVLFLEHSHFDDVKTRDQGRPIFEMRPYIKIQIPGDMSGNVFRPIRPGDAERFPQQWKAFESGKEQTDGLPLAEVSWLSKAQVDELAFFRIRTVEQLASVSDSNAQKFMGLNDLRRKAQLYVQTMKEDAPFNKMNAELASRDEQISTLTNQLAQAMDAITTMQAMLKEQQTEKPTRKSKRQELEENPDNA